MSRPHDAQRSSLHFGNPFRMILPKGSYLSPKLLALLNSFEQTLEASLINLKPENNSDVLSLSWMRQAMKSLSDTHSSIKTLITDLQFPVSDWDEKWMDMYLDDSVKLLDICISLMSELSRLDQSQLVLKYVLHILALSASSPSSEQLKLAHSHLHDWMQQIHFKSSNLDSCFAILQDLTDTLHLSKVKNSAKGKVLMRALYGVKVETIFVSSIFTAALSGCPKPLADLQVSGDFLWADAFNNLQAAVNGEVRKLFSHGKSIAFKEIEAVTRCAENLQALWIDVVSEGCDNANTDNMVAYVELGKPDVQEDQCKEPTSDLTKSAESFSFELDGLSKQVDDFFQIVLLGRDSLLSGLRISDANLKEIQWFCIFSTDTMVLLIQWFS